MRKQCGPLFLKKGGMIHLVVGMFVNFDRFSIDFDKYKPQHNRLWQPRQVSFFCIWQLLCTAYFCNWNSKWKMHPPLAQTGTKVAINHSLCCTSLIPKITLAINALNRGSKYRTKSFECFDFGDSLDAEFNSASIPYPHCILLGYTRHPKMKISIKNIF